MKHNQKGVTVSLKVPFHLAVRGPDGKGRKFQTLESLIVRCLNSLLEKVKKPSRRGVRDEEKAFKICIEKERAESFLHASRLGGRSRKKKKETGRVERVRGE